MAFFTTYTRARATLAALCDRAAKDLDPVIIHRRNSADVALISAEELAGLLETAHLLRSPRNAERLLAALRRARRREGRSYGVTSPKRQRREGGRRGTP